MLSRFFEVARQNDKVFVELFFWKNVKEAMEITEGYGTAEGQAPSKLFHKQIFTSISDLL